MGRLIVEQPNIVMDGALRRALLRVAEDFGAVQQQIDCADLALEAGYPAVARALYDTIFLRMGFLPDRLRWHADIRRRHGWATEPDAPETSGAPPRFSVDLAVAELAGLFQLRLDPLPDEIPLPVRSDAPLPLAAGTEIASLVATLVRLLAATGDAVTAGELAAVLDRARFLLLDGAPVRVVDHANAALDDLGRYVAAAALADWLLACHGIAFAPFGSPELLHAAARLHPAGLGPCFDNVPRIVRSNRDVFGLVQLAEIESGVVADADRLDRWSVLLASRFDPGARLGLLDDFGDIGLLRPVRQILADIVRRPDGLLETEMLWRIRDAGIDNGDHALGIAAQDILARRRANNTVEWMVLGELQASANDFDAAETSLRTALALDRDHLASKERLAAVHARQFQSFAVTSGFGSSRTRKLLRLARRQRRDASAASPVQPASPATS